MATKKAAKKTVTNPLTPEVVRALSKQKGATLQEMADQYGVTREAVRLAFKRNGYQRPHAATIRSRSKDAEISQALTSLSRRTPAFSIQDVLDEAGATRHQWTHYRSRHPLSKAMQSRIFMTKNASTTGKTKYPLEVCVEAVRRYIESDPEGYTSQGYAAWAKTRKRAPSAAFIQKRWKWSEICEMAGGQAYAPMRKTPYPKMSNEYIEGWIDKFFSRSQKQWDNYSYQKWAKANGAPSLATVRDRLGTWDSVRAASLKRLNG